MKTTFLLLTFVTCLGDAPGESPDLRDSLVAMWAGQRSAVMTATFQYRSIMIGGSRLSKHTRNEVNEILSSVDLVREPDGLKRLYDQLASEPSASATPWSRCAITFDGERVRELHILEGSNAGERRMENVYDGDVQITTNVTQDHGQAVLHAGRSAPWSNVTLFHFRFVPNISQLNPEAYAVSPLSEGTVLIRGKETGTELEVDITDGLARRAAFRGISGDVVKEIIQFGRIKCGGEIIFPAVVVCTRYQERTLSTLRVILIETAAVNKEVADSAFVVSVPKDTVIVDKTRESMNPRVFRLRENLADVAVLAEKQRPSAEAPTDLRVLAAWMSLAALVAVAAYVARAGLQKKRQVKRD